MVLSTIARRAITAAVVAAASAAGAYAWRRYAAEHESKRRLRRDWHVDESRWEGEGGSPPDATAAVPHEPLRSSR